MVKSRIFRSESGEEEGDQLNLCYGYKLGDTIALSLQEGQDSRVPSAHTGNTASKTRADCGGTR